MIEDAARATRKFGWRYLGGASRYSVVEDGNEAVVKKGLSPIEAFAACDRLNLVAVLKAIREPSNRMIKAGVDDLAFSPVGDGAMTAGGRVLVRAIWRAMIEALKAEAAVGGK